MGNNIVRKIIFWVLAYAVSIYLGAIFFLYMNQRALQYTAGKGLVSLEEAGIDKARLLVVPTDLISVRGWYIPPEEGKPVIVYYSGNSGSFTSFYRRFALMSADGYGFVGFDYRGFPMSPGAISEQNILMDSLAVFDWAAQTGAPLVIWGRSLGSGPATYVASLRDAKVLVLETPFTAAVDVAAERYPFIPLAGIMKDTFLAREWIKNVQEPVFVAHGTADRVIPVHDGEDLFEMAPNGQELWIVEGGTHSSLWSDGLWGRVKAFIERQV